MVYLKLCSLGESKFQRSNLIGQKSYTYSKTERERQCMCVCVCVCVWVGEVAETKGSVRILSLFSVSSVFSFLTQVGR